MLRMFDIAIDRLDTLCRNTKLIIEYKFAGDSGWTKNSMTIYHCDNENMSKIYDYYKKIYELDSTKEAPYLEYRRRTGENHRAFNLLVMLTIFGKLNGFYVDEKFTCLESFRKYLEDNSLIPKMSLELKPKIEERKIK